MVMRLPDTYLRIYDKPATDFSDGRGVLCTWSGIVVKGWGDYIWARKIRYTYIHQITAEERRNDEEENINIY